MNPEENKLGDIKQMGIQYSKSDHRSANGQNYME